ncbi:hypothetical protein BDQ12DRAFT_736291 [Crucibulum laeve]|uniref:DUF6534 domain-containing protein n=1 Tax=Crucibulum laeve TaxID=68775 RepID=A0A5C3LY12_9AGAR|nr:hypothetical protein BDQ12DRAFT_736291 [Crucibulum laeve]
MATLIGSEADIYNSIGVAFFGFTVSAVLYGITVLQAYQYFLNSPNDSKKRKASLGAIFMGSLAVAVGVVFLFHLQHVNVVLNFAVGFEYVIYMGFGTTAVIDSSIALAMCIILCKSRAGSGRTDDVVSRIIRYFVGSGLVTSLASILCLILYVARPDTLLYLSMEFSISRLYANSFLSICNDRRRRLDMLDAPRVESHMSSDIYFAEPSNMNYHHIELSGTNCLSPKLWSRDLKAELEGLCGKEGSELTMTAEDEGGGGGANVDFAVTSSDAHCLPFPLRSHFSSPSVRSPSRSARLISLCLPFLIRFHFSFPLVPSPLSLPPPHPRT